jgi:hypothetical protein
MATDTVLQLAESIVADGFDSFDAELAGLLAEACRSNVSSVLVEVAGDRSAPTPVRERALGRVIVELFRTASRPASPRRVTSRVHSSVAA